MFRRKINLYEGGTSNDGDFDQLDANSRQNIKKKSHFEHIFESVDMYGEPISLKYQGRSTYNTVCGGVSTMVTVILILIFLINKTESNQEMKIQVQDSRNIENLNKGIRTLIAVTLKESISGQNSSKRNLQDTEIANDQIKDAIDNLENLNEFNDD